MVDLLRWYCEKDRILEVEELWDLLDKQKPPAKAADPTGGFRSHQPIDERHCMLEPPSTPKLPHLRLGVTLG
jgi:hypothetical protein